VTFFLIVAGIERAPLLSPRAWGMGQSVDNGALLFSQHAHLSPANRLPPTRGKRASPARLCLCAPRRADRTSGAVHLSPRGHKPRVPMIAFMGLFP
jgi:hypothetical protein